VPGKKRGGQIKSVRNTPASYWRIEVFHKNGAIVAEYENNAGKSQQKHRQDVQCKYDCSNTGTFADTQNGEKSEESQNRDGGGNAMKSDQMTDVFNRGSSRNNSRGCVRQNGQAGGDAGSKF
jgi:hypothetical protein